MKPYGKGKKSYDAGVKAAKNGKTERDNPYLYCRIGQGGKTLGEWWRLGFLEGLKKQADICNFREQTQLDVVA